MLKYEKDIAPLRLFDIYINLENYCRRKIRAGEKHFRREFFEILKLDLEKENLQGLNHILSQNFYKNILQNAAELKEFEWADEFIESYKNELRTDYREAVYCYCKAYLEAEKNNYEKSLDYLAKLKTDEVYLKIDLKLLQARLYYELNEYDVLVSAIDSIRHFLKDNKFIAENRRSQLSMFVRFLSALNNAQLKKEEFKIMELKENIQKAEDLQWKDWFVKKVEELEDTNIIMTDRIIENKVFKRIDYSEKELSKGEYDNCKFISCNFSNSDLSNFTFVDCVFDNCNFSMARMKNTCS